MLNTPVGSLGSFDFMRDHKCPSLVLQAVCLLQLPRSGRNTAGMLFPALVLQYRNNMDIASQQRATKVDQRVDVEKIQSDSEAVLVVPVESFVDRWFWVPQMFS